MGRRILLVLLGAFAGSISQLGYALGLGEITLKSALNQPLNAEIQLLEVRDLTESEILIGLASAADFERVGVDRPYFLTDLKFKVDLKSASGPVIHVTSRKLVREPYLNFVLQAQWPSGRLLREYTVLMDLPLFSDTPARPVAPAKTSPAKTVPAQQTSGSSNYNPRSSYDQAPGRSQGGAGDTQQAATYQEGDSYKVQANDTLWEIAKQVRPDRSVSIQQTMLAMQQANPQAFINNNINLLKKGQILRIPSREQIVDYKQSQAVREVAAQNARWSGAPSDALAGTGSEQLDASRNYQSQSQGAASTGGRVKLSSPEEFSAANEGRGSGAGESSQEALENELAITLEQLDKTERENSDLRSRIASLEEQITTMERMVELTNDELRALQLSAAKTRDEQSVAEAAANDDQGVGAGEEVLADSGESAGEAEDTIDAADVAEAPVIAENDVVEPEPTPTPVPTPTVSPTKVVIPAAPQKTLLDHVMDNILYIALGLLVVIGGIVAFLKFRNKEEENDSFDDDFIEQPLFAEAPEEPETEDEFESLAMDDLSESEDELEREDELEEPEQELSEPETEDVVGEADIYIAYGKYDQAEEMLSKAIAREPSNPLIRAKLLEVYAAEQDADRFDPQYAALIALGDADAVERAAQLRETIRGASPFDASLYSADSVAEEPANALSSYENDFSDLSLDLDTDEEPLSLDLPEEGAEDDIDSDEFTLNIAPESSSDEELDEDEFELSLDLSDDEDLQAEDLSTASGEAEEDLLALDEDAFDLSLGDEDEAASGAEHETLDFGEISLEDEGVEPESLDDEFELDLDLGDELATDDDDFNVELAEEPAEEEDEDVLALDVPDEFSMESEGEAGDDFDLDLEELDSVLDVDDVAEGDTGQFDLSELDALSVEDDLDNVAANEEAPAAEPEVDDDFESVLALDDEPAQAESRESDNDDLDLESELDLSALDEELDALTSDLSVESADIDDLESLDSDEVASSDDASDTLEMEEPITDFDDLDADIGMNLGDAADELEAELELGLDDDDALQPAELPPELEAELEFEGEDTAEAEPEFVEPVEPADETDESLFDAALADVPSSSSTDFEIPEIDPEGDDDLGFLSDSDETATKLDLARAYIDMGDAEGAKDILDEIMKEGTDQQKQEAEALLSKV
ncbi:FimV/HubP family polar landmark protein [Teredinibacter turnerae]|uniref:FimV/HubP family polar landmark protein n=1 Tax=Teredinibacter turnerae TaxID=2426 RepID=UPI0005F789DE|nr:FimV/HubP family polar landmark protein [Teredinibacter turnerae]